MEGFPFGSCATEGSAAAESEEGVLGSDVGVEAEGEGEEAEEGERVGEKRGEEGRRRRSGRIRIGQLCMCVVDEPAGETARVDVLKDGHADGDWGRDGRHARGEEEGADDRAVEVVKQIEEHEQLMVEEGHAGAEEGGGGP